VQGSTLAQTLLGIALLQNPDGEGKHAEALRWLSEASSRGGARAAFHLGVMYESGLGVPPDYRRARELYEQAARHGEFLAAVSLARLLSSDKLGAPDVEEATYWYREAVSQEDRVGACPELQEAREYLAARRGRVQDERQP
jgi:TPR repeat protein